MESENILEAKQVSVAFRIAGKFQKAIYDIDLSLRRGEVLAIVGESGGLVLRHALDRHAQSAQ
ncbi:hypothetical protein ACWEWN_36475, partial [Streptomyces rochei]